MARILLVEDDPLISEVYRKKFEASGLDVLNVTTGKAVLKAVEEGHFDLVLLDLVIPEMSGMDVLKELRTNEKYPRDLKVVVFSNLSDSSDRKQATDLGADGYLLKTEYTPSKLVEEVNRLLELFEEQSRNVSEGVSKESKKSKGKRILFVEDEPIFVDMFGRRLIQEGYGLVSMENGHNAVAATEKETFDLIITDAMLPGMTGEEIIEQLQSNEKTKHIPVILLSASLEPEAFERISKSGGVFKAFLKTEVTPSQLAREVNEIFEGR